MSPASHSQVKSSILSKVGELKGARVCEEFRLRVAQVAGAARHGQTPRLDFCTFRFSNEPQKKKSKFHLRYLRQVE